MRFLCGTDGEYWTSFSLSSIILKVIKMSLKAVLFDMDGVLIDSETFYCDGTYDWMQKLGYTGKEEEIYPMIGTTMERTYEILYELLNRRVSIETLREINETYFTEHPLPYDRILKPGAKELLEFLKQHKISTAVCSSSSLELIETALRECGIGSYFDYIVSGEQFTLSKPNPEIYLHAAEVLQVRPEDCLVIEDSTMGIRAGCSAGMKVIALDDPKFSLDQSEAHRQVRSLKEVKQLLSTEMMGNC